MDDENDNQLQLRKYFRAKSTLHHHRPWFIYTAAREMEQPFSLEELQEAIYRKVNIRPQISRLLEETHKFYEQYDVVIINRLEPGVDSFTVNQDIDLDKPSYRDIIRSPQQRRGRPPKHSRDSLGDGAIHRRMGELHCDV